MKTKLLLFILAFTFFGCTSKSTNSAVSVMSDSIPEGAIPFEYDFERRRLILIPGALNDTIPVKYALETGAGSAVFSDAFACDYENEKVSTVNTKVEKPMTVRIGDWVETYGDSIYSTYLSKDHLFFGGGAQAFLPWEFFENKIIEISFSRLYIRELTDVSELSGYDSVKVYKRGDFLRIPVVVYLQGKKIEEPFMFDTGSNGTLSLAKDIVSKYDISIEQGKKGDLKMVGATHYDIVSVPIDSLGFGNSFTKDNHMADLLIDERMSFANIGTLGNKFFENFDIVIDLKNFNLYMKPINR